MFGQRGRWCSIIGSSWPLARKWKDRLITPSRHCLRDVLFFVPEKACWILKANLFLHCPLPAGVSSLISLLASAREEDQPRLSVLLCEAVVAVYLSLLIHGLGTHSSNELFRLAAHPLNNRMWAAVFGGGAKVIIKPKRPELPPGKSTVVTGITDIAFLHLRCLVSLHHPILCICLVGFAVLLCSISSLDPSGYFGLHGSNTHLKDF